MARIFGPKYAILAAVMAAPRRFPRYVYPGSLALALGSKVIEKAATEALSHQPWWQRLPFDSIAEWSVVIFLTMLARDLCYPNSWVRAQLRHWTQALVIEKTFNRIHQKDEAKWVTTYARLRAMKSGAVHLTVRAHEHVNAKHARNIRVLEHRDISLAKDEILEIPIATVTLGRMDLFGKAVAGRAIGTMLLGGSDSVVEIETKRWDVLTHREWIFVTLVPNVENGGPIFHVDGLSRPGLEAAAPLVE